MTATCPFRHRRYWPDPRCEEWPLCAGDSLKRGPRLAQLCNMKIRTVDEKPWLGWSRENRLDIETQSDLPARWHLTDEDKLAKQRAGRSPRTLATARDETMGQLNLQGTSWVAQRAHVQRNG